MTSAPGTPRERFATLLWRLIGSQQWDRALGVARDWLAEEPDCVEAHQPAAQSLVNLDRFPEAHDHAQRALAGAPHRAFLHRLASIACFHQGYKRPARHHAAEAIRLEPNDAMNWYHLGRMHYQDGQNALGAQHARHARELAPHNADILNLLALCEADGPLPRIRLYEQALALDPENAVVHNNVGVHHLNHAQSAADYARAAGFFRRALEIDPTDAQARRNLRTTLREGDPVYRFLRWPRRFFDRITLRIGRAWLQVFYALLVWAVFNYAMLIAYGAWLVFGQPLLRSYEWLTEPDVRAQTGELGARRRDPFRRGPRWARVGGLFVGYAGTLAVLWSFLSRVDWEQHSAWLGALMAIAVIEILGHWLYEGGKFARRRFLAWRGERRLRRSVPVPPTTHP